MTLVVQRIRPPLLALHVSGLVPSLRLPSTGQTGPVVRHAGICSVSCHVAVNSITNIETGVLCGRGDVHAGNDKPLVFAFPELSPTNVLYTPVEPDVVLAPALFPMMTEATLCEVPSAQAGKIYVS